jgi:two-component system sensor histidine kinase UhpB
VRELGHVFNEMLDRLEAERRESGRRALAAQETERKRVAQELHDEVGQSLTAVLLQLNDVAARVPPELRLEIMHAQEAARGSLEDVRRVARQLRPEALDDLGLPSALAALSSRFTEQTGLRVRRRIEPLPPLPPDTELVLYRVAQECLTNVARHAEARVVELEVTDLDGTVELRVRDDGCGFRPAARDGHGIQGMRERAMLVGAELSIGGGEQGGTEVRLRVPLEATR